MNPTLLLWPVVVQVLLTLSLFFPLARRKKRAVAAGLVDPQATALNNSAWPEEVVRVSNNIQNQSQLPVLFYALCAAFMLLGAVNALVLGLAWLFVASRIAHSYVHIRTNFVPHRMRMFIVGFVTLLALTLVLVVALLRA